jgi:hypothetical protein
MKNHYPDHFGQLWKESSSLFDSYRYSRNEDGSMESWGFGSWEKCETSFSPLVNSEGFLGGEFVCNPEIIALGCSVTAPVGLPPEYSWPHLIHLSTGKSVNTIAFPGSGVQRIVRKLFSHIAEYGKPKDIFFLMPDIRRIQLFYWNTKKRHISWDMLNANYDREMGTYIDPSSGGNRKQKSLIFYNAKNKPFEIPEEVAITQCLTSIHILVDYCYANDINLKIASWNIETQSCISLINEREFVKYENTAPLFNSCDGVIVPVGCYQNDQDFANLTCHSFSDELQEASWNLGFDKPNPHPGLHPNIHYAEMFLEEAAITPTLLKSIKVNGWQ